MIFRFLKYSQIRIYTGLLYLVIMFSLTELAGVWYGLSMAIAFLPSYALEFLLNHKFTYGREWWE